MVGQAPDHLNREHPSRRLFSRLGRPVGRSAGTALSNFAVSHRLSPLKVSAFFKRTLRPPALRGAFFAQSGAHLFAVLCANRRTSAQTSRTAPICCIFLQQTPSFCPMGERPFSHPPSSHDRESPHKHSQLAVQGHPTGSDIAGKEHLSQTGLYQLLWGLSEHTPEHSAAAYARPGRGIPPPSGSRPRLLHREAAASRAGIHSGAFAPGQPRFAASRPGIIFPSAHKPRPHLESCISGPGTCAGCNYFCRFPSKSRQTAAFFV